MKRGFVNWTEEDGLAHESVQVVFEDSRGFIWLGTLGGLQVFDGHRFKTFKPRRDKTSISGSLIQCIAEDDDGLIYIGTDWEGMCIYDPLIDEFECFKHSSKDEKGISSNRVYDIYIDGEQRIWISTIDGGINLFDKVTKTFDHWLVEDNPKNKLELGLNIIHRVVDDENDPEKLLASSYYGMLEFDKRTKKYRRVEAFRGWMEPDNWPLRHVLQDGKAIWMTKWGGGIVRHDRQSALQSEYIYDYTQPRSGWYNIGLDLEKYDDENLLFASKDKGVGFFNTTTQKFSFVKHNPSDPTSILPDGGLDIYKAKNGSYWFGMRKGLSCLVHKADYFDYNNKFEFKESDGFINCYSRNDSGMRLYGQINRLRLDDNQGGSEYIEEVNAGGIPGPVGIVNDIISDSKGHFWIGIESWTSSQSPSGLFCFDLENIPQMIFLDTVFESRKVDVMSLLLDEELLWVGTKNRGVYCINVDKKVATSFNVAQNISGGEMGNVLDIKKDDQGRIWFFHSFGVHIFDPATEAVIKDFEGELTFNNGSITGVELINDSIFAVSSSFGLTLINVNEIKIVGYLDETNHLISDHIYAMVTDGDYLWLGHRKGMTRYNTINSTSVHFDNSHGLPGNACLELTKLENEEILALFDNGKLVFSPLKIHINLPSPKVYIHSVKAFDNPVNVDTSYSLIKHIKLPEGNNYLSIEYSAIQFPDQKNITFAYMLEGLDEDWNYVNVRRSASYSNLKPGDYIFHVKATNSFGEYDDNITSLRLTLEPYFYQTNTFWLILGIISCSILYFLYSAWLKRYKREHELEKEFDKKIAEVEMTALRAQMNPHFIFNSLNSIKYFIIKESPKEAASYLDNFSKLIRLILVNSNEKLITIEKELEALRLYVEIEQMRFEHKFDYTFDIRDKHKLNEVKLPPLLLQPYVENAIWHGLMHKKSNPRLTIKGYVKQSDIIFEIEDNGIGRHKANLLRSKFTLKKKSMGMELTKNRMDIHEELYSIETEVSIVDLYNSEGHADGTRVEIILKSVL